MIEWLGLFGTFLKASLLSSGGLSNLPALRHDLLAAGLASPADFGRAVAIGQLSPGPSGLWAVSLGYLVGGWPGGLLALLAITLPPLLVLPISAGYRRARRLSWVPRLLGGISVAGIGLLLSSAWSIAAGSGADWRGWAIGLGALGLAATRKVNILVVLVLAGLAGVLLYR